MERIIEKAGEYGIIGIVVAFLSYFLWSLVNKQFPAIIETFRDELAREREAHDRSMDRERETHDRQLAAERHLYAQVLEGLQGEVEREAQGAYGRTEKYRRANKSHSRASWHSEM